MKINLKLISLITILCSLFYLLGHKNKNNNSIISIEQVTIVDKKTNSANLPAPKVYISVPRAQNGLTIGNNWKSK